MAASTRRLRSLLWLSLELDRMTADRSDDLARDAVEPRKMIRYIYASLSRMIHK
jgi:hypothetical protein